MTHVTRFGWGVWAALLLSGCGGEIDEPGTEPGVSTPAPGDGIQRRALRGIEGTGTTVQGIQGSGLQGIQGTGLQGIQGSGLQGIQGTGAR